MTFQNLSITSSTFIENEKIIILRKMLIYDVIFSFLKKSFLYKSNVQTQI